MSIKGKSVHRMRLRDLEQRLQVVKGFTHPKLKLEQYATDAHLAACMMYTAETEHEDIGGRSVLDLGVGCGMLSIASVLMGSECNVGVDIDLDAILQANFNQIEVLGDDSFIDLIHGDVQNMKFLARTFDTVILNPPFGTKNNAGIDMVFLEAALGLTEGAVYSMHKSSTRDFIIRKARESWEVEAQVIAQMSFNIGHQFSFHRKEMASIEVDLIRLNKK